MLAQVRRRAGEALDLLPPELRSVVDQQLANQPHPGMALGQALRRCGWEEGSESDRAQCMEGALQEVQAFVQGNPI